nr:reductive dehalogenase [uncultured prokaryote]
MNENLKIKDYPYKIQETLYQRFEEKNNMIYRRLWDKSLSTYRQMFQKNINMHINSGKAGYSRFDFSAVKAGWTVYEKFPFAFAWKGDDADNADYGTSWTNSRYQVKNINKFSKKIKGLTRFYGASLVGIADVDKKWIYRTGFVRPEFSSESNAKEDIRSGAVEDTLLRNEIELPEDINKAIVIGIEMHKGAISTAPAQQAAAAASIAYSKMAFVISCLGEFIRNMGYKALQCGNDTALSVPLAIDAGLGGLGRIGILVTPEYGPRVRIAKVFTDMPLKADRPNKKFINKLKTFCKNCTKCAKACEVDAIPKKDPTWRRESISNNSGALKYYVDVEKCFEFWVKNSSDCGKCIAACPFSKINKKDSASNFWGELV